MDTIKNLYLIILDFLANLEFKLNSNRKHFFFREQQLKYLRFKYVRNSFRIGNDVYFKTFGNVTLGNRCCIGSFSRFWNYAPIHFGDDFMSAGGLTINTGSHHPETLEPYAKEVIIGERVWCGVNVTILAGVKIGNDVIIGAGSVVVNDIPSGQIVAGVPAKFIKALNRENIEIVKNRR